MVVAVEVNAVEPTVPGVLCDLAGVIFEYVDDLTVLTCQSKSGSVSSVMSTRIRSPGSNLGITVQSFRHAENITRCRSTG